MMDGPFGTAVWEVLEELQRDRPELFAALVSVVWGSAADVPPEHLGALRVDFFLRPDDTPVAHYRDVLLSSYRETAEGAVLVNPFRLDSGDQARRFRAAEAGRLSRLRDLLGGEDAGGGGPAGH